MDLVLLVSGRRRTGAVTPNLVVPASIYCPCPLAGERRQ
jgi:hypothetical protein